MHHKEQPPLDATRESPRTAMKTQHSQREKKKKIIHVIQSEKFYHHSFDNASYAIQQLNQRSSLSLIFLSLREKAI